jgi:hypothetical protein
LRPARVEGGIRVRAVTQHELGTPNEFQVLG